MVSPTPAQADTRTSFSETPLAIHLMTWSWSSSFPRLWFIFFTFARARTPPNPSPFHHLAVSPTSRQHPVHSVNMTSSTHTWLMKSDSQPRCHFLQWREWRYFYTIIPWPFPPTFVSKAFRLEFIGKSFSLWSWTMVTGGLFYCLTLKVNLAK